MLLFIVLYPHVGFTVFSFACVFSVLCPRAMRRTYAWRSIPEGDPVCSYDAARLYAVRSGSRNGRVSLSHTLRRWGLTWCYIRRFARDMYEYTYIHMYIYIYIYIEREREKIHIECYLYTHRMLHIILWCIAIIYVYIYIYIYTHIHIIYIYIYYIYIIYIYICLSICVYLHTYVYIYIYMYISYVQTPTKRPTACAGRARAERPPLL